MTGTVLAVTILITGSILPAWAGASAELIQLTVGDRKGNTTVFQNCQNASQTEFQIKVKGKALIELSNGFTTKATPGTDTVKIVFDPSSAASPAITEVSFMKKGNTIGSISASDIGDSLSIEIHANIANLLVCEVAIPKGTVHLKLGVV